MADDEQVKITCREETGIRSTSQVQTLERAICDSGILHTREIADPKYSLPYDLGQPKVVRALGAVVGYRTENH